MPETAPHLEEPVTIDLNRPMNEVLAELSKYPIKTRLKLNGTLIVARDIAHAKIKELLDSGKPMPEYFKTTLSIMQDLQNSSGNGFRKFWSDNSRKNGCLCRRVPANGGSMVMLAKGNRSKDVTDACAKHGGFYLGSIGGPAAVLAKENIKSVEVVDFEELGMEAVRKIEVVDFPAFIITDDKGNDFFANLAH